MKNILERIMSVFRVVFEDDDITISESTTAEDIEAWDSLKHMQILAMLENEFDIRFEVDDILKMENVADIIAIIQRKTNMLEVGK